MKVRNGFVSNSSSSSFILYGVSIKVHENVRSLVETAISGNSNLYVCRYFDDRNSMLIGRYLGEVDRNISRLGVEDIEQIQKEVIELFEKFEIKVDKNDFGVISDYTSDYQELRNESKKWVCK